MKVIVTKAKAGDLEPGDLFSNVGSSKWDAAMQSHGDVCVLGVLVYIRTSDQCPESRAEEDVYRITIEQG